MKLATLPKAGSPDGMLAVVSTDLSRAMAAPIPTLQAALENWNAAEPVLRSLAAQLDAGTAGESFDQTAALAPLPRAWQWLDGSAFKSHSDLMSVVFHRPPMPFERPLMYQGMSDRFLAPTAPAEFPSESDGIDFEGEFGVITDFVPMGISATDAAAHIKLLVLINDWSLRILAPIEMNTGFGWVQAKPACSMAPLAVTPDALGPAWANARVKLPLHVWLNGEKFGAANGAAMAFSFAELVAHAAATRDLVAGTIIGSGTVSNENFREIGSSCIAERRGIELLDHGEPATPFMKFGDSVRMEAFLPDGQSIFGAIAQNVAQRK